MTPATRDPHRGAESRRRGAETNGDQDTPDRAELTGSTTVTSPSASGFDPIAPAPTGPRIMSQFWADLAFLHWFVPPAAVAPMMPARVRPDVLQHGRFAGLTPVALVPFRMVGAGFGKRPAIPYFGTFWETNVRLYSIDDVGRHGVVFRSLDASRLAVVAGARAALSLPYRFSRMRGHTRLRDGHREFAWTTRTRWPRPSGITSRVAVSVGDRMPADDLATFVTARWGLHTTLLGRTIVVPNHHQVWSLRAAEVLLLDDNLLTAAGFPDLAGRPPDHVCFSDGVRTTFGLPRRLPGARQNDAATPLGTVAASGPTPSVG